MDCSINYEITLLHMCYVPTYWLNAMFKRNITLEASLVLTVESEF